jgi:hypothetical protein
MARGTEVSVVCSAAQSIRPVATAGGAGRGQGQHGCCAVAAGTRGREAELASTLAVARADHDEVLAGFRQHEVAQARVRAPAGVVVAGQGRRAVPGRGLGAVDEKHAVQAAGGAGLRDLQGHARAALGHEAPGVELQVLRERPVDGGPEGQVAAHGDSIDHVRLGVVGEHRLGDRLGLGVVAGVAASGQQARDGEAGGQDG